jgi:hypothetical protein
MSIGNECQTTGGENECEDVENCFDGRLALNGDGLDRARGLGERDGMPDGCLDGLVNGNWCVDQFISPVVSFQPNRIVFGGGIAPLTPAQVQKYEPTLDNLRAAATAKRKVTIYWDNVNHTVPAIIVRWDQSC